MRLALAVLIALGWVGACSEGIAPNSELSLGQGVVVSDPTAPLAVGAQGGGSAPLPAAAAESDNLTYASLLPGTVPQGYTASVRSLTAGSLVWTTVRDGGFTPVAVTAAVGDTIEIVVRDAAGAVVYQARTPVAAVRAPIVVRTYPPPRKRDVPLNAALVIVFSEPVDEATLSPSSVRLVRGAPSVPVAGTVRLLQGAGTGAVFTPAAPLVPNTAYRLIVTRAVRDLDGDILQAGATVAFTTGQSSTGPAASLTVSPDTVYMTAGTTTYQMTATVWDAAGNVLIDQPVTWSTSDPGGLAVSPTGLVTALAAGSYYVTAAVNGLSAAAFVSVAAGPPASMTLAPTQATVGTAGDTIKLMATVRDAAGRLLLYPSVTWTSSDAAVATVAPDGAELHGLAFATVAGVSLGSVVVTATATATSDTASATASITVTAPPPVASVTVSPASATVLLHATRQLSTTLRDANGRVLTGRRSVTWSTSDPAVATVDATGLVTAVGVGSAVVSAAIEGVNDTAAITVTTLSFSSVSAGYAYTCALTTSGAAYCWGDNSPSGPGVESITTVPVPVSGGHTFSSLSAGTNYTCGVATNGAVYCWGVNVAGQFGDGTTGGGSGMVSGGLTFSAVSVSSTIDLFAHTCGVITSGTAYCWGANYRGQLGIGSAVGPEECSGWSCSTRPLAVIGGLTFSRLGVGAAHTCGLATNGTAYCWGENGHAQLGIGTAAGPVEGCPAAVPCSTRPLGVAGGLTFSELDAGFQHTCGLATNGTAYCWGFNSNAELGIGSNTGPEQCPDGGPCSTRPVPVAGGLTFSALSVGWWRTCGLTAAGEAYCWGGGIGSPVAVPGGLTFSALSTGVGHACGITVAGTLYCWGGNGAGELGDGTRTDSSVPVKVAGQP